MANYAVQADLEKQFGLRELQTSSDRDGRGEIDVDVITKALTDATEEINSYVSGQYDLPLTTTPGRLVTICGDIALYKMSADIGVATDEKRKRYEDAVKWLTLLATGKVDLGLPAVDVVSADLTIVAGGDATTEANERLFTRTKLEGLL